VARDGWHAANGFPADASSTHLATISLAAGASV
jgi:hypothetical protein